MPDSPAYFEAMARNRWVRRVAVPALALVAMAAVPAVPASAEVIHCRTTVRTVGDEMHLIYGLRSPAAGREYVVKLYLDGERVYQKRLSTNDAGRIRAVKRVENPPGVDTVKGTGKDTVTGAVCAAVVRAPRG